MCETRRQRYSAIFEILARKITGVSSILVGQFNAHHRCDRQAVADISMCDSCDQRHSKFIGNSRRQIVGVSSILVGLENQLHRCDNQINADISVCVITVSAQLWFRNPIAPNTHRRRTNRTSKNSAPHLQSICVDEKCKQRRFDSRRRFQ